MTKCEQKGYLGAFIQILKVQQSKTGESSDLLLNKAVGQVWDTAVWYDFTPVRLRCGAERCVWAEVTDCGESGPGDFTVIKRLIHTHSASRLSVNLETHTLGLEALLFVCV